MMPPNADAELFLKVEFVTVMDEEDFKIIIPPNEPALLWWKLEQPTNPLDRVNANSAPNDEIVL